jgi:hypothetical protein
VFDENSSSHPFLLIFQYECALVSNTEIKPIIQSKNLMVMTSMEELRNECLSTVMINDARRSAFTSFTAAFHSLDWKPWNSPSDTT